MATVDYLVVTGYAGAFGRALRDFAAAVVDGDETYVYGFRCKRAGALVVGYKEQTREWLVSVSGSAADGIARSLYTADISKLSVARIDIQATITVPDADMVVGMLTPKRVYTACRVTQINNRGATLYIGSATSRARMRVYNKSAESALYPDEEGEYLRFEIQLRDKYADAALKEVLSGAEDAVLAFWLGKMLSEHDANWAMAKIKAQSPSHNPFKDEGEEGWIERRKRWIETTVIPAIRSLVLVSPSYLNFLLNVLQSMRDEQPDE